MTDIVERLRADAESTDDIGLCSDAADEIVHLGIQIDRQRQIIYELRSEIQGWKDRWIKENADHAEDVATAKHEIDALRQQLFEEHEAHLIAEQKWIEKLASCQARIQELRSFVKSSTEYAIGNPAFEHVCRSSDDSALNRLLAEGQAREKVLLDALENHQNMTRPIQQTIDALAQPIKDTALQDLILKERTRAVDTYKHLNQELVLKDALAAERELCKTTCQRVSDALNGEYPDDPSIKFAADECVNAIGALGDQTWNESN